ncbi:hypothetical protein CTAM01_11406 [Colletotrichum tamarilloi]|uniref:Zn(2)-C6 fungal-type domain-containing protein n=1 Tax=Colletotrichum tamarilloi TaxID=1209934 RepID=A0ABQ9QXU9_9PEZI|nr:uncharacterized protein CTAM01_11406 [Colletotrichum tamarilloi]KAK1488925.1 hypothetical protein CTAM01_11406 [Colletotrichum tamarilloi]
MSGADKSFSYAEYLHPDDAHLDDPFDPQPTDGDGLEFHTDEDMSAGDQGMSVEEGLAHQMSPPHPETPSVAFEDLDKLFDDHDQEIRAKIEGADGATTIDGPSDNLQQATSANDTVYDSASKIQAFTDDAPRNTAPKSVSSKISRSREIESADSISSSMSSSNAARTEEATGAETPDNETSPGETTDIEMSDIVTPASSSYSMLDDDIIDESPSKDAKSDRREGGRIRKCPCLRCHGQGKPKTRETIRAHLSADKIERHNMLEKPRGECRRCREIDRRKCYQWPENYKACSECTRYKELCSWE